MCSALQDYFCRNNFEVTFFCISSVKDESSSVLMRIENDLDDGSPFMFRFSGCNENV